MANSWFRMYHEFSTDPKVQMMSEVMQRRLVMLFCMQCGNVTETLHETEIDSAIAFHLRISETEWQQTKDLFIAKGFLNSDCQLLNWDKRQFESDSSTARVKAYRERKKKDETELKRFSNGLDTDTDTDTDTEQNNKTTAPQAADSDSVSEIFSHWKTIMNHPKAKLDEKRKKKIREALKLGYTHADLIAAIDGCAKSPYHMGQDGRNFTVYDDLELILRDAKHIDQFLKFYAMPHPQVGGLHAANQQSNSNSGGASNRPFAEIVGQQARDVIQRIGGNGAHGDPGGGTVRQDGGLVSKQG